MQWNLEYTMRKVMTIKIGTKDAGKKYMGEFEGAEEVQNIFKEEIFDF